MKRIQMSGWEAERAGQGGVIGGRRECQPNGFPDLFGFRRLQVLLLGAAALTGCTGGGSGDGDGGLDGGGAGGAGGAGGGGGGTACEVPAGATVHLDYTDLRVDPSDVTDGSVVRSLVVENNGIYLATLDQVVKLGPGPAAPPTQVVQAAPDDLSVALVDTDDGFRTFAGGTWRDQTGGSLTYPPAVQPIDGINAPAQSIMAPSGVIFSRFDDRDDTFDPAAVHYVGRTAGAADQAVLVTSADPRFGWGRTMFFSAGAVWSTTISERIGDPNVEEQAVRIGLDGSTQVVEYTPSGMPFLATENFIYYNREADTAPLEELGVWRAPIGGGMGEKITGDFGGWEGQAAGNQVVLRDASTIVVIEDQPGATAVQVAELPVRSVIDGSCTSHGLTVKDGKIYSSMFDEAGEKSLVFSYDIP